MLYVVGTPLGNLEDLSIRQAKTIAAADILLTEDTRTTGFLLHKIHELFSIAVNSSQKLVSYYKDTEFEKLPQVLEWLQAEKQVVLISQAGMPLISDPGYLLIHTAVKHSIPFQVIPGATAATTALIMSGFNPAVHSFIGFLPKKESEIRRILQKIQHTKSIFPEMVFIFYESPNRVQDTLKIIDELLPDTELCIARELTKKFEEVTRGKAHELINQTYKGELTVVLS